MPVSLGKAGRTQRRRRPEEEGSITCHLEAALAVCAPLCGSGLTPQLCNEGLALFLSDQPIWEHRAPLSPVLYSITFLCLFGSLASITIRRLLRPGIVRFLRSESGALAMAYSRSPLNITAGWAQHAGGWRVVILVIPEEARKWVLGGCQLEKLQVVLYWLRDLYWKLSMMQSCHFSCQSHEIVLLHPSPCLVFNATHHLLINPSNDFWSFLFNFFESDFWNHRLELDLWWLGNKGDKDKFLFPFKNNWLIG